MTNPLDIPELPDDIDYCAISMPRLQVLVEAGLIVQDAADEIAAEEMEAEFPRSWHRSAQCAESMKPDYEAERRAGDLPPHGFVS
jgi:hypothetical protein